MAVALGILGWVLIAGGLVRTFTGGPLIGIAAIIVGIGCIVGSSKMGGGGGHDDHGH